MGFTFKAKAKTKSGGSDNWGMGLLLIFFPADDNNKSASILDNNNSNGNISSSPSSQSPSTSTHSFNSIRSIRRTSSSLLFTKAQSTISICALLVFLTLLLFTLSTFEPTVPTPSAIKTPRRFLSQRSPASHRSPLLSFLGMWDAQSSHLNKRANEASSIALQGMGTLYRRGTRAMSDLIVAHVVEDVKDDEFRLFLRLLHRSGLTARADIAFLFASSSSSLSEFGSAIKEENESFLKLVQHYKEMNGTRKKKNSLLGFDLSNFVKPGKKEMGEPLWGKRIRGNYSNSSVEDGGDHPTELTQLSYGSIVGFEVTELDPENSLSGFLDHVPMSLRRWACYPMLLGRVRRNFKHVALIDVKNLLLLGDPLGRVRSHSPETVHISIKQDKHTKRNSDKTQSHHHANSAIIMGGTRGVRLLSNAMLTEIVRAAMQHKRKSSVTESGTLSQLVNNEHILKNINLITSTESIPDASSLSGSNNSKSALVGYNGGINIMQRGNSNHNGVVDSIIMKLICSCEVDSSSVYKNC